jgi:hypothetical protein
MKILLLTLFLLNTAFAHEKVFRTKADAFATGSFRTQKTHSWPFALLSIGHNMQSYQNYDGSPYWHDGLDIRGRESEVVHAAAGGVVVNIENYVKGSPLYWEIAILDEEGFVWKYHHIAFESISEEVKTSFKQKSKISAGALIGNIVRWPSVAYGEVYHHLHLLVVGQDKQYINPFLMLEPLSDTQAPVIRKIGLAQNHSALKTDKVTGEFSLYADVADLILHNKFIVPPHKISYSLDKGEEKLVWEFIHLPSGTSDELYINDFYLDGSCGNYSCRKLLINLNFSQTAPRGQMKLLPGAHEVEVMVEDIVGNKASSSYQWTVY